MSDTTLSVTPPPVTPFTQPKDSVKSGWRTTEFYGTWAVKILGVLLASGVFGDGSTAQRGIGAALTLLALFGYTASRTIVKAASGVLLFLVIAHSQVACTPSTKALGSGLWNCLAPERAEAVDALTPLAESSILAAASADGSLVDASRLKAATSRGNLTTEAGVLLQCAMASAVTSLLSTTPKSSLTAAASPLQISPVALRAAWSQIAPPGARFRTANGDL